MSCAGFAERGDDAPGAEVVEQRRLGARQVERAVVDRLGRLGEIGEAALLLLHEQGAQSNERGVGQLAGKEPRLGRGDRQLARRGGPAKPPDIDAVEAAGVVGVAERARAAVSLRYEGILGPRGDVAVKPRLRPRLRVDAEDRELPAGGIEQHVKGVGRSEHLLVVVLDVPPYARSRRRKTVRPGTSEKRERAEYVVIGALLVPAAARHARPSFEGCAQKCSV
jgi:hypothetical protein